MTPETIQETLLALRKRCGSAMLFNYFSPPPDFDPRPVYADEDGLAFLNREPGLDRFYFLAADHAFVARAARAVEADVPVVTDIIAREDRTDPALLAALEEGGFGRFCLFRRMRNAALPKFETNERLSHARPEECAAVDAYLRETFDPLNSHFPPRDVLAEYIRDETVLVNRGADGGIHGLSVFHLQGTVCNYDYLANQSEDMADTLAMLFNTYGLLARRGITSAFLWVDETNTGVRRMHQRFGFKPDGTVDHILVKQPAV